jgi:hypothetical protein
MTETSLLLTTFQYSLPISFSVVLILIIISIASNSMALQRKNSELSTLYSEISMLSTW